MVNVRSMKKREMRLQRTSNLHAIELEEPILVNLKIYSIIYIFFKDHSHSPIGNVNRSRVSSPFDDTFSFSNKRICAWYESVLSMER